MPRLDGLPFQVRWATPQEFDRAHLATVFQGTDAGDEFWAAIVVNKPPVTIVLGGTRVADSGHCGVLRGTSLDIGSPTWTWRREGDDIVLSMAGVDVARLRESGAHLA